MPPTPHPASQTSSVTLRESARFKSHRGRGSADKKNGLSSVLRPNSGGRRAANATMSRTMAGTRAPKVRGASKVKEEEEEEEEEKRRHKMHFRAVRERHRRFSNSQKSGRWAV